MTANEQYASLLDRVEAVQSLHRACGDEMFDHEWCVECGVAS